VDYGHPLEFAYFLSPTRAIRKASSRPPAGSTVSATTWSAFKTNPAIRPVVERLRADHRAVSDYLDAVEAAARSLSEDDGQHARSAVADALEVLKGHLLAHLDYEELNVAGTARRLRDLTSIETTGSEGLR
jgi:hypothetical protein